MKIEPTISVQRHNKTEKRRQRIRHAKDKTELDCLDRLMISTGNSLGLEDLTKASVLDDEFGNSYKMDLSDEGAALLSLKREMMQITRVIKCMGRYLLTLCTIYMC